MSNATNEHAQEILALVVNAHQHSLSRASRKQSDLGTNCL